MSESLWSFERDFFHEVSEEVDRGLTDKERGWVLHGWIPGSLLGEGLE